LANKQGEAIRMISETQLLILYSGLIIVA